MITLTSEIGVKLVKSMGNDTDIVLAAKVSTDGSSVLDGGANTGLINYLMQHKHGTPFEHASLTFLVHAPIFVWREWHRHRIGFSYNEESARYKTLDPVFYIPDRGRAMMKVEGWKPGRPKFLHCESDTLYSRVVGNLTGSYQHSYDCYLDNLGRGIDPGLARDCLPVGIYSSCFVTCNPRSLMAFLSLRTSDSGKSYPLHEIEVAAKKCEAIFAELFPITHDAFNKNGRNAP